VAAIFIFNPQVDFFRLAPDPAFQDLTPWLTLCRARAHLSGMNDPLSSVFAALADPTRRAILSMLLEDDMAVTDVAAPFEMSLAAISKHLTVLTDAGLISREKRGRVIWCKLEPDALRVATIWMQGFGQFEPVDLDAFERFLRDELHDDAAEADGTLALADRQDAK
jgi:DNA-binding transcriptional ArsR family regulator